MPAKQDPAGILPLPGACRGVTSSQTQASILSLGWLIRAMREAKQRQDQGSLTGTLTSKCLPILLWIPKKGVSTTCFIQKSAL